MFVSLYLQAVWRGYCTRRNSKSKKLARARARVIQATESATEEKKLGNRTSSALDFLLKYKHLSQVFEAVMHLGELKCCNTYQKWIEITQSVQMFLKPNASLTDEQVLVKLYKVTVYDLRWGMKEDYPGLKYFKGDN